MPDWTKAMHQSFEYYTVEPTTLADIKRLDNVKKASFSRDSDTQTLGSATIDVTNSVGESYIRGYLVTNQNGVTEKFPLGTVLSQTPSSSFNGKILDVTMDCYTPLIELKEKRPPLGYTIRKGTRIMDAAYDIVRKNCRVPVNKVEPIFKVDNNGTCQLVSSDGYILQDINGLYLTAGGQGGQGELVDMSPTLQYDFVADTDDTWLSFVIALINNANYELGLGERGDILFLPKQKLESLQPVWTFDDSNSSILLPDITVNHDLYGIPNVVEVIYSYGTDCKQAVAKNEDPNSPTSIIRRGREIPVRVTDPSLYGYVTQDQIQAYAERVLEEASTLEYTVSYTHAYCPVRIGDCVRLNYTRAGIKNIKAKVISQNIKAELGCQVSEKAVFTSKLWR